MSETPTYFLIAQLNTLMTLSLRLAIGFALLAALALLMGPLLKQDWKALGGYWTGWLWACAMVGGVCALGVNALFPYPNIFIQAGFNLAVIYGLCGLILALIQWKTSRGSMGIGICLLALFSSAYLFPSFSRSNQVLITVIFALPVALCLSYFPLLFRQHQSEHHLFHGLWVLSFGVSFGLHHFWLYPQIGSLPPEGEFFPYINLYDWFLFVFMILYLGNLYLDYWLKAAPGKVLTLGWHYLVLVSALVCLWFNSSIFDTLAL